MNEDSFKSLLNSVEETIRKFHPTQGGCIYLSYRALEELTYFQMDELVGLFKYESKLYSDNKKRLFQCLRNEYNLPDATEEELAHELAVVETCRYNHDFRVEWRFK